MIEAHEGSDLLSKDDNIFEVEFMNCLIDKADNLVIKDCDTHFSEFVGVHYSKIKQGKLFLHDVIVPQEREEIMQAICKKDSQYLYFDFNIYDANKELVHVYCTGQCVPDSTLCRLTFADISRSVEKSKEIKEKAKEIKGLIELVGAGVTLFKVHHDMHFEGLYMNEACCKFLGTTKQTYKSQRPRLDDLFHPDDKSVVYQAIGNCMATKTPISLEVRVKGNGGEYTWMKMNSAIQRYDKDGSPIFHAIFANISNVKNDK